MVTLAAIAALPLALAAPPDDLDAFIQAQMSQRQINGLSLAILHDGEAVGVAQISRKGEGPAEAGPDFTAGDLKKAQDLFEEVGPYLVATRPDRF